MYKLPKLEYLFQDLEPFIDIHTMGLHYHKHHQKYLNKLNELLKKNNYNFNYSLEKLLFNINEFSKSAQEDILFNLGGVLNHNLYWKSISPKQNKLPTGKLKESIDKTYGSFDEFWTKFKENALKLKGSGYTFLVLKRDGVLDIINTSNQETPLSSGFIPLLNIDLWEHAYYINYENDKSKYIDNFTEIADFNYASEIFNSIMK